MKISIITTFYNSVILGDFVHRSMNCLLNQTYQNIEFVCVNDGSNDDTLKQLNDYAKKDSRIIIIDKKNEGVAQYAKAAGQDVASGEFIMLFDHDDILSYDAVEKAVNTLIKYPYLEGVSFIVETLFINGKVKCINNLDLLLSLKQSFDYREVSGKYLFQKCVGKYDVHFRGLIKKNKFKMISYRYKEMLMNGDEITERLIFRNLNRVGSCSGIYKHIIYPNSSAKSFNLKLVDIVRTDVILRDIFKKYEVYDLRKHIFEKDAYKSLVNAIKVFNYFKDDLSMDKSKFYKKRLRESYNNLDKKIIIESYSGIAKLYHIFLLSSFNILIKYYSIKS